jgi:hypothetical protein
VFDEGCVVLAANRAGGPALRVSPGQEPRPVRENDLETTFSRNTDPLAQTGTVVTGHVTALAARLPEVEIWQADYFSRRSTAPFQSRSNFAATPSR